MGADYRQQQELEEQELWLKQWIEQQSRDSALFAKEVWDTLSRVDCSDKVEKKMNLSYLSWAWAWSVLMDHYPASYYNFKEPVIMLDRSVEIWVTVRVSNGVNSVSREMWLPVMDHRNSAIIGPDARQISDTRMRALVKCISMHGLGAFIYAGEDLPRQPTEEEIQAKKQSVLDDAHKRNKPSIDAIKEAIADGEPDLVVEAWEEITDEDKRALWVAPSKFKNAPFTTKERDYFKGEEYVTARNARYQTSGAQSN
jgi:hypothetical protein